MIEYNTSVNEMEPIILYLVLFFRGIPAPIESISFSLVRELSRIFAYTIPSLALLWYLITDKKGLPAMKWLKPKKQDLLPFLIGLPGLIIIGLGISLLVKYFSKISGIIPPPMVEGPFTTIGWFVIIISCLGTGYLEESYFRYYLLIKLDFLAPVARVALSAVLFSLCHIYEGPWGIMNAALAGIFLSLLFIRFGSIHGIAFSHGVYNIFVYITGSLS